MVEYLDSIETRPAAVRRRYIELLEVLTLRQLDARYRGSRLGVLWSLFNPAIMTGVYTAIFGKALLRYYGDNFWHYAIAVFVGLVTINLFSGSTSQALTSLVYSGPLLNKIRLPVTVFPLSFNGAYFIQFALGPLPLLVIMAVATSRNAINVLGLLLPLAALAMLCLGASLLVSVLYVYFRDLQYFYELVVFLLWITSPIFYPEEIVPLSVRPFLQLNPIAQVVTSLRQIAISGDLPDLTLAWHAFLSGVIVLAIGVIALRMNRYRIMEMI